MNVWLSTAEQAEVWDRYEAGEYGSCFQTSRVDDQLEARDVVLMRRYGDETPVRGDGPHSMSGGHRRVPTARKR